MYESSESKDFKKRFGSHLKRIIMRTGWDKSITSNGQWILECVFIQSRTNQDNNNYYKILCDTLTEYDVIEDDKNILVQTKRVLYDSKNPKFFLKLYKSQNIGIFNNMKIHDDFICNNCDLCNKSKNKCTIYKDSIKGKIRQELDIKNNKCLKFKHKK